MKEIERLTADRFKPTITDMWRSFCRHAVDVENEYMEKDGPLTWVCIGIQECSPSSMAGHSRIHPRTVPVALIQPFSIEHSLTC